MCVTRFIEVIELVLIRSTSIRSHTLAVIYHHFFAQIFFWQHFKTNPLSVGLTSICFQSSVHHVLIYTYLLFKQFNIKQKYRKIFDKLILILFIFEQIIILIFAFKELFIHQCHTCLKLSCATNLFIYCLIFKNLIY